MHRLTARSEKQAGTMARSLSRSQEYTSLLLDALGQMGQGHDQFWFCSPNTRSFTLAQTHTACCGRHHW